MYLNEGVIRAKDCAPLQAGIRVSNQDIITRRGENISELVGFKVNEYVPFYFSPLTSMAFSISKGNVTVLDPHNNDLGRSCSSDMALIVARVNEVAPSTSYKFTDAACNTSIPPNIFDDIQLLEQTVKWDLFHDGAIKARIPEVRYPGSTRYFHDVDHNPRYHNRTKERMAEFMVHREFPMALTCCIVTMTTENANMIRAQVNQNGSTTPVLHKPDCFY